MFGYEYNIVDVYNMFFIYVGVVTSSNILNKHYTVYGVLMHANAARSGLCWVPTGFPACQQPPTTYPLYDLPTSTADSRANICLFPNSVCW